MSKEFYAPYNFVSTKDLPDSNKTDWAPNEAHPNAPQARHDKWVNNTKSGRILCCLETKTPMV